jgi:hypothetical protein
MNPAAGTRHLCGKINNGPNTAIIAAYSARSPQVILGSVFCFDITQPLCPVSLSVQAKDRAEKHH